MTPKRVADGKIGYLLKSLTNKKLKLQDGKFVRLRIKFILSEEIKNVRNLNFKNAKRT